MTWPFDKDKDTVNAETQDKPKPDAEKAPDKSPAELIAEALKPFGETLTNLSAKIDAVEQATKKPEPKQTEPDQPMSVLDDENIAFAQRLTPLMLRQLELEARIVRGDIKAEYVSAGYGDLWNQYEKEINMVIEGSPIVAPNGKPMRGDPEYIRNVVDMVFGRAARKAGMRFDGKSKGFFLETGGGADGPTRQPENDGLTDGQRKVFGRMKVSLDDAKKVMGKLKFVQ